MEPFFRFQLYYSGFEKLRRWITSQTFINSREKGFRCWCKGVALTNQPWPLPLDPTEALPHVPTRASRPGPAKYFILQGLRPCTPPGCRPGPASAPSLRSGGTPVGFASSTFDLIFIYILNNYFQKYKNIVKFIYLVLSVY